jgi:hypothetical protein
MTVVVAWSPDHATRSTVGLRAIQGYETYGRASVRGPETRAQQRYDRAYVQETIGEPAKISAEQLELEISDRIVD